MSIEEPLKFKTVLSCWPGEASKVLEPILIDQLSRQRVTEVKWPQNGQNLTPHLLEFPGFEGKATFEARVQ